MLATFLDFMNLNEPLLAKNCVSYMLTEMRNSVLLHIKCCTIQQEDSASEAAS